MARSLAMEIISAIADAAKSARRPRFEGPEIERDFEVGKCDRLEISAPFDVDVEVGPEPRVHAVGAAEALEMIQVNVVDGRLFISCERDCQACDVSMTVALPTLTEIRMSGPGDVSIDGIEGENFACNLRGPGDLDIGSVATKTVRVSLDGPGDLRLEEVRCEQIDIDLSGPGDMDIDSLKAAELRMALDGPGDVSIGGGSATSASIEIRGPGDVEASEFHIARAVVKIGGPGDVAAHVTEAADIDICGLGDVHLTGGAKCSVGGSGPGEVHCS